jgi:hypothetical protein
VDQQSSERELSASHSPHWSKDFVEHLRLVHFVLVVAAVGLIAVSSGHSKSESERAREQLSAISAAETHLMPAQRSSVSSHEDAIRGLVALFAKKIERAEAPVNETDPAPLAHLSSITGVQARLGATKLDKGGLDVRFSNPKSELWSDYYTSFSAKESESATANPFAQLSFFRDAWSGFEKHEAYESPSWIMRQDVMLVVPYSAGRDRTIIHTERSELVKISASIEKTAQTNSPVMLYMERCGSSVNELLASFGTPNCSWAFVGESNPYFPGGGTKVFLPLGTARVHLGLQNELLNLMGNSQLHAGSFDETFPDLADLAKGSENLPLPGVDTLLRDLSEKSESFEFETVKFPAEETAFWGILILGAIQFYFWIQLFNCIPRPKSRDDGWDVAWVCMYDGKVVVSAVLASIVALPAFAIGYAGLRSLGPVGSSVLAILRHGNIGMESFAAIGLIVSISLSTASYFLLAKMRHLPVAIEAANIGSDTLNDAPLKTNE